MTKNNRIVVDLNKVQYASFCYINQHGQRSTKAHKHSVHGGVYNPKEFRFGSTQTLESYAIECDIKDVWRPVLRLQLTANHSLTYEGKKAKSIWAEWNRRIFKKK